MMKISSKTNIKYFGLMLSVWGILSASSALAVSPESIFVDIVPVNPAPYENTTISLRSFAANLDSVSISWTLNGKSAVSGIGQKSFSVTVGGPGTETTITANIFLPDGQINKTVVLRPSSTTLLWQGIDSYVPPFYKGKALPSAGSKIKVVAMPEIIIGGVMASPKNMTYSWKKNFGNQPTESGYGKSYYVYTHDFLEGANSVSVDTLTVDQQYASSASVNIGTIEPEIVFYRKNEDLGTMWEHAVPAQHVIAGEEVLVASPYFLSPKDLLRPELIWSWFINDSPISIPTATWNVMPLQATAGSSGTSKLRLEIENTVKFFSTTDKEIFIQF